MCFETDPILFCFKVLIHRFPNIFTSFLFGEKHLSFYFEDFYSTRIKAISFGSLGTKLGDIIENSASIRSAIVSLTLNTWDGQENVELNLEDIIV